MYTIDAKMRDTTMNAKQLRRSGIVPCAISGSDLNGSLSIQIDQNTARQIKRSKRDGSKVDVLVDGRLFHTLIKDLEYNNVTDSIVHISFILLKAGQKTSSVADVILLNKDKVPGILEQVQLKVPHAAEPEHLLDTVTIDLAGMPVGTTVTIGDISEFQSEHIELQTDPGNIVFRIKDKLRADAQISAPQAAEQ